MCATCPVLQTCRQFAMESRQLYGVWGGLTEAERHRLAGRHRTG
ncbi:WhiB family transcriptional regulator [Dietzia natronolimnaea]